MPPPAAQKTLLPHTLVHPTGQHQGKLSPFAKRSMSQRYHMANRPNKIIQKVQAPAQPIIHPIIAEFARKVAKHQRLVQRLKSYTRFRTILAQRLCGLDQLLIRKQTSHVIAIRRGELAATLNQQAIWGFLQEMENNITRGGICKNTPHKVAGLLQLKVWCNCNTPPLTIPFAH
jgi:hypothetical protein